MGDKSVDNYEESGNEDIGRKDWIRFEEKSDKNVSIHIPIETTSESSCATIEPSNSIQIINTSENIKTISDSNLSNNSVVTNDANFSPQTKSILRFNDNSNNSINNNNERRLSIDTNNTTEQNQCNHSHTHNTYSNGDVIVTLLPLNTHCSWLTPAVFKPELVPEELMAQSLSLTVEDYVSAMQVLTNDLRFNLYTTLYKRVLILWIALGFVVLLWLLFSGIRGLALFAGGILWLIINALGIFISMWIKVKLYHLLERCISHVNGMLYKYNILLGVDDRGKISCHKINLVFIYFDVTYCIKFLKDMLENENQNSEQSTNRSNLPAINTSRMGIDTSDIVITGTAPKSLPQKEKYAEKLLLRYSQRWVKDFIRKRIDLNLPLHADSAGVSVTPLPHNPRHCPSSRCLCQFIEEHLRFKPLTKCSITELFM